MTDKEQFKKDCVRVDDEIEKFINETYFKEVGVRKHLTSQYQIATICVALNSIRERLERYL